MSWRPERDEVAGLNLVGLRRRGVPREAIIELKEAFRLVYFKTGNIREVAAKALAAGTFKSAEARAVPRVHHRRHARDRPVAAAGGFRRGGR